MELADQQVSENEALVADVPAEAETAAPASAEKPEKPLSIREQLTKSIETVRTEEAKRARAADGKFAKLEAGAAEKPATETVQKTEQNAQPGDSKPAGPPSAWKGIWENLTPEAQALAVKREAEVAKGFDEYRTKTAQLTEISQALDPLRPMLQQHGIQTEAQAVKRLLEWEGAFRNPQTRVQAFHNLAKQYGVDLSTLVPSSPGSPSTAQDIPEPLRPVIDQFGQIQQTVQDVASRVQNWEQNTVAEKISSFAKDKPHFEAVRSLMGQLMQGGIVQPGDLDGAYQKAIAIHPEVSAQIKADEEKNRQAELAKTNADKLNRARSAAVSPSARPPSGIGGNGQPPKKAGVRESILNAVTSLREEQRA